MNHVTHPSSSTDIMIFSSGIFAISEKKRYRLRFGTEFPILSILFESLNFLINGVKILMIRAKLATPGLPKIKIFRSKSYDNIILDYDVNNKILSSG